MAKEYNKINVQPYKEVREEDVSRVVDEEIKVASVVSARPTKVKRGLIERGVRSLLGPDGIPSVSKHVMKDIIGPAARDMLFSSLNSGLQMLIYKGDPTPGRSTPHNFGGGYGGKVNYGSSYRAPKPSSHSATPRSEQISVTDDPGQLQPLSHGTILQDWTFELQSDALNVHERMREISYKYGKVKVANYYELMNLPTVYTDNNFGWTYEDIDRTRVVMVRGEYVLQLPPITTMM